MKYQVEGATADGGWDVGEVADHLEDAQFPTEEEAEAAIASLIEMGGDWAEGGRDSYRIVEIPA